MGRLILLLLVGLLLLTAHVGSQERRYLLAVGKFGGTEAEVIECYFSVGLGAMLVLHPSGEPCRVASDLVGRTGMLVFIVDERSP